MRNLKLNQRLLGSSAIVIATFIISAILVGASLGDVRRDADFLRGDAIPGMSEMGKLRLLVSTNITRLHGLVLIDNSDERKAVEGEIRETVQAQADLLAKYIDITTDEEKRLNARVKDTARRVGARSARRSSRWPTAEISRARRGCSPTTTARARPISPLSTTSSS